MLTMKQCSNCIKGVRMLVNDEIICQKKGIVACNYLCRDYQAFPDAFEDYYFCSYNCSQCVNFLSEKKNNSIGTCRLFTVRKFNGQTRKICVKFIKKLTDDHSMYFKNYKC